MSQQPSRPGPFFCTQLLFVPPTPGQPAKPDDISQHPDKALAQNLLWKAGTVLHVRFFDGVKEVQDKVMKYARQWTEHANISFEVVTSGDAEIRIKFNEGGPLAYVGTSSLEVPQNQATMNLVLNSWWPEEEIARASLHGFGHALGLKHVHSVTPSDILWEPNQPYTYYQETQKWSKTEVAVNVLNLLAADGPPAGPRRDTVMIYSIPASLTANDLNIQGGHVLTTADIAVIGESFQPWNDLNVGKVVVPYNANPAKNGDYWIKKAISPPASGVPSVATGVTTLDISTDRGLLFWSAFDNATQSNIDHHFDTWNNSLLYTASLSVFWATPSRSNHNFKTGKERIVGQQIYRRISFGGANFESRPRVFVGLSGIEVTNNLDLDVTVVSVDRAGFYVNFTSGGNIGSAQIDWIAWPENEPGIETGSFYGNNVALNKAANGEIQLESAYDSQPKVHFALAGFSASKVGFRLILDANVSKTSLSWSATAWADTTLSRVRANYLVFKLTDLVTLHPTYASAYNNRAQARRLLGDDNIHSEPEQWSVIWDDLCEAIRLATPTVAGARVSVRHGNLLAAAHMQRGLLIFSIVRSTNDSVSKTGGALGNETNWVDYKCRLPKQFWGLDTTDLEAMASRDFETAGRYGNKVAWEMSAATNPYARLCGEIVKEAIRAEIEGGKFQDTPPRG